MKSCFRFCVRWVPQRQKAADRWTNTASCPALSEESGPGRRDLYCDGPSVMPGLAGAAQLRASGKPDCVYCLQIAKCTSILTETAHGRPGRHSSRPMPSSWVGQAWPHPSCSCCLLATPDREYQ